MCLQLRSSTRKRYSSMIQQNKSNLKSRLCTCCLKIIFLSYTTTMRTTIIFISFCSSARKVKSILFSRKKVASMKKWLHNILENAFQPCSIFILWIHQLFTETSNLRTFCLIQMVLLSSLISGGPIILMMTIEDLPIVEHQSILLRR